MGYSRIFRVLTISAFLAAGTALLFLYSNRAHDETQTTFERISALDASAKKRFLESRGLTPCRYEDRLWLSAAERKLRIAGRSSPRTLVVVSPTFSDVYVLAWTATSIERYTFPGQTGFDSDFVEDDRVRAKLLEPVTLPQRSNERLLSALSRNTEYAMSSPESGFDGVMYYFKTGTTQCAFAWSPTEGTVVGDLGQLVELLTEDHPASSAIDRTLDSLEALELPK